MNVYKISLFALASIAKTYITCQNEKNIKHLNTRIRNLKNILFISIDWPAPSYGLHLFQVQQVLPLLNWSSQPQQCCTMDAGLCLARLTDANELTDSSLVEKQHSHLMTIKVKRNCVNKVNNCMIMNILQSVVWQMMQWYLITQHCN